MSQVLRRVTVIIKWDVTLKQNALIEDTIDAFIFFKNYLKYSFVYFGSIFSSFQCLHIVRFEWDIVLSSSYDGWDKRGYTMWCPREGNFPFLNCLVCI